MQTLDMASAEEYGDTSSSTSEGGPLTPIRWRLVVKRLFQLVHLLIAASFLMLGLVEFGVEHSIFDIFGKRGDERSVIPKHVFQNATIGDKSLEHILDAPVLVMFLIYFLGVVWLKCSGKFAWLLTLCQALTIGMFLTINLGLETILDWRYFSTRAIIILLDVLIFSFDWTVIVVVLLHIRGWFPFKVKKYREIPYHERNRVQKVTVIFWNFVALYVVLSLCFLIWFSKLYMSWACVHKTSEILLMCQFTNMVQCWPCSSTTNHCEAENITECIQSYKTDHIEAIRCISPLYTVEEFPSAFCVFNYNIGPFTFVTVFSYVGGIYFFLRTVLNALVKCIFNIGYIGIHCCYDSIRFIKGDHVIHSNKDRTNASEIDVEETQPLVVSHDPRLSLLGPLPHLYSSPRNKGKNKQT